jgi:cholesterol oxidase
MTARWLSNGIEVLIHDLTNDSSRPAIDFDVVIVGSGYGGAISAVELAGSKHEDDKQPVSVCVLERGREFLPGMFPARMADIAGNVRFSTASSAAPRGTREGLFDLRLGPHLNALVANGLGGGSLINAGVMAEAAPQVFAKDWPHVVAQELPGFYNEARDMIGVQQLQPGDKVPAKFSALKALANPPSTFRAAPISVALHAVNANDPHDAGVSTGGVKMTTCTRCGDCATGCNHGAKGSLDVSLLARAAHARAKIYTGATVLSLAPIEGGGWSLQIVLTDQELRSRAGPPFVLRARRVILAAGAYGSTEILLRSGSKGLPLSSCLGKRFSSNGDLIAAGYLQDQEVNAVASETTAPCKREVGPTITGLIDLRTSEGDLGYVVEEMAIPGPLRRLFEEAVTTVNALHDVAVADGTDHKPGWPQPDPLAVNPDSMKHTSVLAVMGHDGAGGKVVFRPNEGDGAVSVLWPDLPDHPVFEREIDALERLHAGHLQPGGKVLPNPMWRPVPDSLDGLFAMRRGPPMTVHPLGGCPMGETIATGVVDDSGRVFRPDSNDPRAVHDGLVVLDGSIVPTSLGINPALTISAVSLRAIRLLRTEWGFTEPPKVSIPPRSRPTFRVPQMKQPVETTIQIIERLDATAPLACADSRVGQDRVIEVTLAFKPHGVLALIDGSGRKLKLEKGVVRIFERARWNRLDPSDLDGVRDAAALEVGELEGGMSPFMRNASGTFERAWRGFWAWFFNRGTRDTWQQLSQGIGGIGNAFGLLWAGATRAGEERVLDYDLKVTRVVKASACAYLKEEAAIHGVKTLTYSRRCNPWKQLTRIAIDRFPGLPSGTPCTLKLCVPYLAAQAVPLLKIVEQENQPTALADLGSLSLYLVRMLLHVHLWSFRKPDDPSTDTPVRLPGPIEDVPKPRIVPIPMGELPDGTPILARLTHYPARPGGDRPPTLLMHGYSASGTTFTHPSVKPNLATYLHKRGHDVWVLDMRTSSGMHRTCAFPWNFEDVGRADIPLAIEHIEARTGKQVDVVAHCMSAAMLSIALLDVPERGDPYFAARIALPERIRRVVLSQAGPAMVMSSSNVLLAYLMQYLRYYLPVVPYELRPPPNPGLADQFLDRILSTLPYPDEEWDIENPPRFWQKAPFATTRHRLDALLGRVINVRHVSPDVLDHIDDLFGRISLGTLAQVIHFARTDRVTNCMGGGAYYSARPFQKRFGMPVLSLHSEDNGVFDFATMRKLTDLFHSMFGRASRLMALAFEGGHQDRLIGVDDGRYFRAIGDFLEGPDDARFARDVTIGPAPAAAPVPAPIFAQLPESIRLLVPEQVAIDKRGVRAFPVEIGGDCYGVVLVPVTIRGDRLDVIGSGSLRERIEANALYFPIYAKAGIPVDVPIAIENPPGATALVTLLLQNGPAPNRNFPFFVLKPPPKVADIVAPVAKLLEDKCLSKEAFECALIYGGGVDA